MEALGHLLLLGTGLVRQVRPRLVEQILGVCFDLTGDIGCLGFSCFRYVLGGVCRLMGNVPGLVLGRLRLRSALRCRVGGVIGGVGFRRRRDGRLLCDPRGAVATVLWPSVLCHLRTLFPRRSAADQEPAITGY
ncbi:hypothetical protein D9M72_415570 [compost metagenome]